MVLLLGIVALFFFRGVKAGRSHSLELWHTHVPKEMTVGQMDAANWDAYLTFENDVFEEVAREVTAKLPPEVRTTTNHYAPNSPVNPTAFTHDWNRSWSHKISNAKSADFIKTESSPIPHPSLPSNPSSTSQPAPQPSSPNSTICSQPTRTSPLPRPVPYRQPPSPCPTKKSPLSGKPGNAKPQLGRRFSIRAEPGLGVPGEDPRKIFCPSPSSQQRIPHLFTSE